jgi:hypothetical protein
LVSLPQVGGGCVKVNGATSTQYTLTSADVGHTVRFKVIASNAHGSGQSVSAPTPLIKKAPTPPPLPPPPSAETAARAGRAIPTGLRDLAVRPATPRPDAERPAGRDGRDADPGRPVPRHLDVHRLGPGRSSTRRPRPRTSGRFRRRALQGRMAGRAAIAAPLRLPGQPTPAAERSSSGRGSRARTCSPASPCGGSSRSGSTCGGNEETVAGTGSH